MNRKDYLIFALLIGLLFAWPYVDRHFVKKHFSSPSPKPAIQKTQPLAQSETPDAPAALELAAPAPETKTAAVAVEAEDESAGPEKTATLSNDKITVTFSSRGASVKEATLKGYRSTLDRDSGPVVLDFSTRRALAYEGLSGLGEKSDFEINVDEAARTIQFARAGGNGLRLVRSIQLGDSYLLNITDTLINDTGDDVVLSAHHLQTGPMRRETGHHDSMGFVSLGVDTLSPGGEGVKYWGGKIAGLFKSEQEDANLPKLPIEVSRAPREAAVDWVAAKNKYFVQILAPEDGGEGALILARRQVTPREEADPEFVPKMTPVEEVSASVQMAEETLAAGKSVTRKIEYFVGPMKYDELHKMSLHRVDVMELGMWRPVGKVLLVIMNFIHDHVWPHNYGLAIILLTLIVKVVFWPITHKSTESMKRMAGVQPQVTQIRAKYKDNPQKMQQEIMALYKEHKINPVGGCLPMLIQIPIFIALFMVLRSAIELRFAPFLWIKDLSEPENLFAGVVGFPVNLLPIFMAVTMYVQQKMTPTTGDPAQAKMMRIMMPGMMLFFLYNYAAGLALYWTTQNLLMIVQQVTMQRRQKAKDARKAAGV